MIPTQAWHEHTHCYKCFLNHCSLISMKNKYGEYLGQIHLCRCWESYKLYQQTSSVVTFAIQSTWNGCQYNAHLSWKPQAIPANSRLSETTSKSAAVTMSMDTSHSCYPVICVPLKYWEHKKQDKADAAQLNKSLLPTHRAGLQYFSYRSDIY